mmetsp:Transcript_30543/g.34831  ORF Transcript_30543/g.34831 Transcript_30543/m.34831 type:complete len:406 (-) Transcript_30543:123-1340(-)
MDALNNEENSVVKSVNKNNDEKVIDEEDKTELEESSTNNGNETTNAENTNDDQNVDQHDTKENAKNSVDSGVNDKNDDDTAALLLSLLDEATQLAAEEKILASARVLSKIIEMEGDGNSILREEHHRILKRAKDCESSIADLRTTTTSEDTSGGWTKLGQTAGTSKNNLFLPSTIYYKLADGSKLTCRIETPIAESLLIPLLSVLNETDLYTEWLPSWTMPRMGIRSVKELSKTGLASRKLQIIWVAPWPIQARELIMNVMAVDDIDHNGYCAVRLSSIPIEEQQMDNIKPDPNCVALTFEGTFLFEACQMKDSSVDEPLLLVTLKMRSDPHCSVVPKSVQNFATKTVIGMMWESFLRIAEKVKDGQMPNHTKAIELHPEFYEWMEGRIQQMLQQLKKEESTEKM